jgi:hypothetical protein
LFLNYSLICISVFPLVSISKKWFTTKAAPLHTAKKKKIGAELPKLSVRIGNRITTSEAAVQLANVVNGRISG